MDPHLDRHLARCAGRCRAGPLRDAVSLTLRELGTTLVPIDHLGWTVLAPPDAVVCRVYRGFIFPAGLAFRLAKKTSTANISV